MNDDRQKVLKLGASSVTLRTFLTGNDKQEFDSINASATTVTVDETEKMQATVDPAIDLNLDKLRIKSFVIEFDNVTDPQQIAEKVGLLELDDYEKLIKELRHITSRLTVSPSKKKK